MATPARKCGRSRFPRLHHLPRRQRQRAPCNHRVVRRLPLPQLPQRPSHRQALRRRRPLKLVVELAVGVAVVVARAAVLAAVALRVEDAVAVVARRRRSEA